MLFRELIELWTSDAKKYTSNINRFTIIKLLFTTPGFKYTFWMRCCTYLLNKPKHVRPLYYIFRLLLGHYSTKYGIEISPRVKIGRGISISHSSGIIINGGAEVGDNLDIRQGVTIGNTDKGVPKIGDNVCFGAGAKAIGNIKIGDNVIIGANAVVVKDVPSNCIVAGVPAKVIKSLDNSTSQLEKIVHQ